MRPNKCAWAQDPGEPTQKHGAIVHRGTWLRKQIGTEIPPKPQSLDKLCLRWMHPTQGACKQQDEAYPRGQAWSASGGAEVAEGSPAS